MESVYITIPSAHPQCSAGMQFISETGLLRMKVKSPYPSDCGFTILINITG